MKNRAATALGVILGVVAALASTASAGTASRRVRGGRGELQRTGARHVRTAHRPGGVPRPGAAELDPVRGVELQQAVRDEVQLKQGDTQLVGVARPHGAQKFVSDRNVLGVIGPSTSQAVITSGALFKKASARSHLRVGDPRVDLTDGKYPDVLPSRAERRHPGARRSRTSSIRKLKAKSVVVIDSQDDYSTPLADAVQPLLKKQGVKVSRESVAATDTDFSSIVTNVGDDVDVVVFATQTPPAAQTCLEQLREQGKKAVVFGTDGAYSPAQYKPRSGYVSVFAPDLQLPAGRQDDRGAVQQVLQEQDVRRLRAPELHGGLVADGRDRQGLRGRQRHPSRDRPAGQEVEHPVDPRRDHQVHAKGDIAGAKFSSTRSRTASTARSTGLAGSEPRRPTSARAGPLV